jgi:hypothetical protein
MIEYPASNRVTVLAVMLWLGHCIMSDRIMLVIQEEDGDVPYELPYRP